MAESFAHIDDQLNALAAHYGFGVDAVHHLWAAIQQGGGDMAWFDHPEFHGPGQWMRGGLIMITDPADHVLKNRIDALCNALSRMLRQRAPETAPVYPRINADARAWDTSGNIRPTWWPAELGEPAASGETDRFAYAYFDEARLLAVRRGDDITWYDTGEHRITGIAHSADNSNDRLVLTSATAELSLSELRQRPAEPEQKTTNKKTSEQTAHKDGQNTAAILDAIERLGELWQQGVLTEREFTAKKQELLDRL